MKAVEIKKKIPRTKRRRNFCGRQNELNICCRDKVVITEGVTSLRYFGEMCGSCSYGGVWVSGWRGGWDR